MMSSCLAARRRRAAATPIRKATADQLSEAAILSEDLHDASILVVVATVGQKLDRFWVEWYVYTAVDVVHNETK